MRILSLYQQPIAVQLKPDNTPLTTADALAHRLIEQSLRKLTPQVPVLSEESAHIEPEERLSWTDYWLVDPLDGTREFINQTGEFCICIAYIHNHEAIFGLVFDPIHQTHYFTTQDGAVKLHNGIQTPLHSHKTPRTLRVVIGHQSETHPQLRQHLQQQGAHQLHYLGSALKFCGIAEGIYDYYPHFGRCSEWDSAAGGCILTYAGGQVVDGAGKPLRYNTNNSLISPTFFASGASFARG